MPSPKRIKMEKMKLAAIINYWSDCDGLLEHCIDSAAKWADHIIVVFSIKSNYGEVGVEPLCIDLPWLVFRNFEPDLKLSPRDNETNKRNHGLKCAKLFLCTHFVSMDADEFYHAQAVKKAKEIFTDKDVTGLVVPCETRFGKPWLSIGLDTTLVPFIHILKDTTEHCFNRSYPYAWIDGNIRIDPTRSLNNQTGIVRLDWPVIMTHMSWVRRDFGLKIRNSTARANIERSTILNDLACAKEGYFCQFYGKTLVRTNVDFGIPDLSPAQDVSKDFLQSDQKAVHKPGSD